MTFGLGLTRLQGDSHCFEKATLSMSVQINGELPPSYRMSLARDNRGVAEAHPKLWLDTFTHLSSTVAHLTSSNDDLQAVYNSTKQLKGWRR